ncbi:uncharacterized protein [Physcomitrium patens]|uniref:Uncharacterized protein n=2 Tax=Physcomitrium patens TaxID=3218 RepID=A0A7I3ZNS2_PHYPA|nr:uncharacterized protein LOC112282338 [Physcomitrium patens]|eukprot:XP_024375571.1 uncharacterized protein LOC112282338 [Physcomitrella patens]
MALVSLSGRCNPPSTMVAQPCVFSVHSSPLSLAPTLRNSSPCTLTVGGRGHNVSPYVPSCSAMFSSLDSANLHLFGGLKDKCIRNFQRRCVVTEVLSVTSSNDEDLSEADSEEKSSGPRAKFLAQRVETYELEEVQKPLAEYMALPASQYSVLDAERIERVDDTMFKCYAHRFKFFNFEVGPVLLVKVDTQPDGCCIRLISCTLEGSPIVVAQNEKFSASMVNRVSWSVSEKSPTARKLISDTTLEVTVEIIKPFRAIPVSVIEGSGNKVMSQLLKVMLPRFLSQLGKDYYAWASGDTSRKPVGTGEL